MYEAVHAHPDGSATVARVALTASEYGFDGIVVRNHGDSPASFDPTRIATTYGIDVVPGVEVRARDPARASGFVGNHRPEQTLVLVHGGDQAINRFAVEQPAVDVLAHPMAGDGDLNHVLVRQAANNGVRIEVALGDVLRSTGGSRVRRIQQLRKLGDLLADADAPFVVSGDPRSHLELRAPRELIAVGEQIGFAAEQIREGLAEWGHLAERNRDRLDESFVEAGVRIVDDDDERRH